MQTHPELVRLLALIESYTTALEELRSLDDPGVDRLIAELDTLRSRAALDVAADFDVRDVDEARRRLARLSRV